LDYSASNYVLILIKNVIKINIKALSNKKEEQITNEQEKYVLKRNQILLFNLIRKVLWISRHSITRTSSSRRFMLFVFFWM